MHSPTVTPDPMAPVPRLPLPTTVPARPRSAGRGRGHHRQSQDVRAGPPAAGGAYSAPGRHGPGGGPDGLRQRDGGRGSAQRALQKRGALSRAQPSADEGRVSCVLAAGSCCLVRTHAQTLSMDAGHSAGPACFGMQGPYFGDPGPARAIWARVVRSGGGGCSLGWGGGGAIESPKTGVGGWEKGSSDRTIRQWL